MLCTIVPVFVSRNAYPNILVVSLFGGKNISGMNCKILRTMQLNTYFNQAIIYFTCEKYIILYIDK